MVAESNVTPKSTIPEFDKEVFDDGSKDKDAATSTDGYYEGADHAIGDLFQFKLSAKIDINSDLRAYESYTVAFEDVMSKGLTFVEDTDHPVSVKWAMLESSTPTTGLVLGSTIKENDTVVQGASISKRTAETSTNTNNWYYEVDPTVNNTGNTISGDNTMTVASGETHFKVKIDDILSISALSSVVNEYTSTTATSQKVASDRSYTNDGKVIYIEVIFWAKLNNDAVTNNVDLGDSASKNSANWNDAKLIFSNNPNVGGSGSTGETSVDTVFVFTYELNNLKVGDDEAHKEGLDGAIFSVYSGSSVNADNLIKFVKVTDSENGDWYRLATAEEIKSNSNDVLSELTSSDGGKFIIKGLDAGTYTVAETKAPDGYTMMDPVVIEVYAQTHTEKGHDTSSDAGSPILTFANATDSSKMKIGETHKYINSKNAPLPETGGMGTTILYIAGGILIAGAAIFFITNRRMKQE